MSEQAECAIWLAIAVAQTASCLVIAFATSDIAFAILAAFVGVGSGICLRSLLIAVWEPPK